ncbi:MAG: SAM-dependent methyltransferase [Patescibacteria group bacterium]
MTLFLILCLYAVLTLIWFVCFIGLLFMTYGIITTRVPFVPIPQYVVEEVKKAIPLKAGDVFYDLGSGDGRVIATIGAAYPGAFAIGVEKAPLPYTLTHIRFWLKPLKNVKTLFKNFSRVPLNDATHIYMYLFPDVVQNLLQKFTAELKPGTRVVSCDFPFKTKEPTEKIVVGEGRHKHTLYMYEF